LVEHLWIILTKQQVLYGLQQFFKGAIGVIVALIAARIMSNVHKSKRVALWDKNTALVILFFTVVITAFWGASMVVDSLPRLFNPEYYSIKDAVNMIQQVK
jgi:Co/Zn/Cd efflux system component